MKQVLFDQPDKSGKDDAKPDIFDDGLPFSCTAFEDGLIRYRRCDGPGKDGIVNAQMSEIINVMGDDSSYAYSLVYGLFCTNDEMGKWFAKTRLPKSLNILEFIVLSCFHV